MLHRLRTVLGLALVGYGLLVVLRVLAHDALLAGGISLALGLALLAAGLPPVPIRRTALVAGIGGAAVLGVLIYNLVTGSGLGLPEWGLLLYGGALLAASRHLERHIGRAQVGTLVGWSFPLLLAPLLLFAIDAILKGPAGLEAGSIARPIIVHGLVTPMAAGLTLFGTPATVIGDNVVLETSRGSLTLGVGLVCAGLYPMVLFLGVLGLHAYREQLGLKRFASYLVLGLIGLWIANLVRLIALAKVGAHWGAATLQTTHAHLGWLLFALFMVVFWAVVLRHVETPPRPAPP